MAAKSKKKTGRKQTKKKKTEQSFLGEEIFVWVTLAVSILLLISNFGFGGNIGYHVSGALKHGFGIVAYLVPFLLFGIVSFLISNKENRIAYIKSALVLVFMILTCTLLDLIHEMGGRLGSFIANLLIPAVGVAGTYVIVIICMIICGVIITGKSALKGVKAKGDQAYGRAREDAKKRRKISEERKAKRAKMREQEQKAAKNTNSNEKRSDHRVTGVSLATRLSDKFQSPEMKEIKSDPEMIPAEDKTKKQPDFVINRAPDIPIEDIPEESDVTEEAFDFTQADKNPTDPSSGSSVRKSKMGAAPVADEVARVAAEAAKTTAAVRTKAYKMPPVSLLNRGSEGRQESDAKLRETAMKLQEILANFGVNVTVTNVSCGPAVTRYELQPEMGVKVSKIVGLADDIKLNLAAADIRIEAPIPGKAAVGIEVPNKENSTVMLGNLLASKEFKDSTSKISFAVGKDIGGKVVVTDIAKMPHVLIAGATGSGKSVCINTLIMSILYKATPDEVKLIMIDPKVVELSVYKGIPHLMIDVVTDPKKAAGALNWAVAEMTRRYQAFASLNVRDIKGYNAKIESMPDHADEAKGHKMSQIVIIVDELADLMMVAPGEVEEAICRLAQLARAAGIHLVIATQRPSVNVITGLIKANMPSRIAFSVTSGVDSRTIIDMNGAEKLLGKGDMLFYPSGYQKPVRVQGAFVSDKEVQKVVDYLIDKNGNANYDEEVVNHVNTSNIGMVSSNGPGADESNGRDAYFIDAGRLIIDKDKASIGMLQRAFKIGFNRAARIMDQLCEAGIVGGEEGTKPRKILMTPEEFEQYIQNINTTE